MLRPSITHKRLKLKAKSKNHELDDETVAERARRYAAIRRRRLLVDTDAPYFVSAVIDAGSETIVKVTFNELINSPGADYTAGFTIKEDAVAATISSAARQTDESVIHFTLSASIKQGTTVTIEYDDTSGDITDQATTPNDLVTFGATGVTNNSTVNNPDFQVFSNGSIEPEYGTGSATFTRSGTPLAQDYEGVYRAVLANEVRRVGLRRVENLFLNSEDLTAGGWSAAGTTTLDTATTATLAAQFDGIYTASRTWTAGVVYTVSFDLSVQSGNTALHFDATNAFTASASTQRFSITWTQGSTTTGVKYLVQDRNAGGPTAITITNMQLEVVSGQTNQVAGEYITTTSSTVAEYKTTTHANTVASDVLTLVTGDPLYPTESVTAGVNVTRAAQYTNWAANTDYSLGDRIYPESYSNIVVNPAEDYYFECTTAGTSHATTEPTWDTTTVDSSTTSDGTVTWTYKGLATYKGVLLEPAATNLVPYSYEIDNATGGWTETNATAAINATGIQGIANTATTITDAGSAGEYIQRTITVTADITHVSRVWFKKDTDTSRFPVFLSYLSGGTAKDAYFWINTQTGATTISGSDSGNASVSTHLVKSGGVEWWVMTCEHTDTGTNTSMIYRLYPAAGSVIGTLSNAATGSAVIGQAELYDSSTLEAIQYSSPIITSGASASRTAETNIFTYDGSNISTSEATALVDLVSLGVLTSGSNTILSKATNPNYVYFNSASFSSYIDTQSSVIVTPTTGSAHRVGTRYDSNDSQVIADGSAGTTPAFDGTTSSANITVVRALQNDSAGVLLKNIVGINSDLGVSDIQTLTGTD